MPGNSVSHGTFTVEREYPFSPETVFAAWTTTEAKRGWFAQGDDFLKTVHEYGLDFRVGGVERLDADLVSGNRLTLETRYCDIVDSERIVATYDVLVNGRRISVSLFSMQLVPTDAGTRLVTTEHGAFLDGLDNPDQRRLGIESDLDQLAGYLERTQAAIISV